MGVEPLSPGQKEDRLGKKTDQKRGRKGPRCRRPVRSGMGSLYSRGKGSNQGYSGPFKTE